MAASDHTAKRLAEIDELRTKARQSLATGAEYLAALERERDQLLALGQGAGTPGPGVDRPPEFLTREATHELIGVSVGTLDSWRYAHRGPPWIALGGRRIAYARSAVLAWLAENSTTTGGR